MIIKNRYTNISIAVHRRTSNGPFLYPLLCLLLFISAGCGNQGSGNSNSRNTLNDSGGRIKNKSQLELPDVETGEPLVHDIRRPDIPALPLKPKIPVIKFTRDTRIRPAKSNLPARLPEKYIKDKKK